MPVILMGCQRSGTTALALALNAAYAREGRTFTVNGKLLYVLDRWLRQSDIDGLHLRSDEMAHALARRRPYGLFADQWLGRAGATLARFAERLAADDPSLPRSVQELGAAIVAEVYGAHDDWGDKYNEYMLAMEALRPVATGLRILLLVRDPAEVATSMVRWSPGRAWCPTTIGEAQEKWVRWHRSFLAHPLTRQVPTLLVDYHEMARPRLLRRLADYCGLDSTLPADTLEPRRPTQLPPRTPPAEQLWSRLRQLACGVANMCEETT